MIERVIMCCEFAKRPATRPFHVIVVYHIGDAFCSVHTAYRTCDEKRWARQDGACRMSPQAAIVEFNRRVTEKAEWYSSRTSLARVEAYVPATVEKQVVVPGEEQTVINAEFAWSDNNVLCRVRLFQQDDAFYVDREFSSRGEWLRGRRSRRLALAEAVSEFVESTTSRAKCYADLVMLNTVRASVPSVGVKADT